MMRPVHILSMMMALLLSPCVGFADEYQDCRSTCAAERTSRNMDCPAAYDRYDSDHVHHQCIKEHQLAYEDCVQRCPTPSANSSSSKQADQIKETGKLRGATLELLFQTALLGHNS